MFFLAQTGGVFPDHAEQIFLVILGHCDLASNIAVSKNNGSRGGSDGRMSTAHMSIIIVDKILMLLERERWYIA